MPKNFAIKLKLILATLFLAINPAFAALQMNMKPGVTNVSSQIYSLHMIIIWICVAIFIVVFGVMLYAIINHRKSKGAKAAEFHESTLVEIIWTIIPFIILIAMAVPATKVLVKMYDTSESDVTIKITGYQWKWHYDYINDGISFFSNLATPQAQIKNRAPKNEHYLLEVDNPIVVPVGKKIRFLMTANDVIHSWWVPEIGVKKDAIPGFINESWTRINKPGTYRGQCAELCGANHGYMPIVVEAVSQEQYEKWLDEKKAVHKEKQAEANKEYSKDELMAKGEEVYNKVCAACHQVNGAGIPGVFPALKGSPIATGDLSAHVDIVLHGKQGTAMQAFAAQLADDDIASVITYERNSWGNNKGDLVQPNAIKDKR